MITYRIVRKIAYYYLSPVYGSGQLITNEVVAGPFYTLSEAEDAKAELERPHVDWLTGE